MWKFENLKCGNYKNDNEYIGMFQNSNPDSYGDRTPIISNERKESVLTDRQYPNIQHPSSSTPLIKYCYAFAGLPYHQPKTAPLAAPITPFIITSRASNLVLYKFNSA